MLSFKVGDRVSATTDSLYFGHNGLVVDVGPKEIRVKWDTIGQTQHYTPALFGLIRLIEPAPVPHPQSTAGRAAASLTGSAEERKNAPMFEGLLAYFPNALAAIAHVSKVGNDQHNPGEPLHWAYGKSTDEADCIIRHLAEKGTMDTSGTVPVRHSAKVAWRALALLERELLEADLTLKPGTNVKGAR